jgi:hypothetical protein
LYSLLERGLIPPNAKITFEQFPIVAKQIKQQNDNKKVMIKINEDSNVLNGNANKKFEVLLFNLFNHLLFIKNLNSRIHLQIGPKLQCKKRTPKCFELKNTKK